MSVSRGRQLRLPTERERMEADAPGRLLVRDTQQPQQRYESEVPVATEDESTLKGSPGTGRPLQDTGPQVSNIYVGRRRETDGAQSTQSDDSLPPSSPINVSFTDDEETGATCGRMPDTPKSFDSAPFWEAVGSAPRVHAGPAAVLFDDHESLAYEDGEVEEPGHSAWGPPSNQEQNCQASDMRGTTDGERREYVLGEHSATSYVPHSVPTASKRQWTGSPVSEELNRSSRRPRRDASDVHQKAFRLPPIQEMMNPWGGMGNVGGLSFRFKHPVAVSTPQRVVSAQSTVSSSSGYANMSGQPPTPFNFSSSPQEGGRTPRHGREQVYRSGPRSDLSNVAYAPLSSRMESQDASGLLDPVDRRERADRNLHDILTDPEPAKSYSSKIRSGHETARWPGGYAPSLMGSRRGDDENGRRPAVDGLGELGERDASEGAGSFFSAIPNTKAWAHKTRIWGQSGGEPVRVDDEGMNVVADEDDRREYLNGGHEEHSRASDQVRARTEAYVRRGYGASEHDWRVEDEPEGGPDGWNTGYEDYGAVPSAMAADEETEDTPVLLDTPMDSKWLTHFDDPETIVGGQSGEWTRVIWKDRKPIVLFTVFNYKYTKDGAVNRHIESSVTGLTTHLTGESKIYVIPPDLDWRYTIKPRDLPFVWAIRGLTEAGAKTMTGLRAVSTKAVSIITYPRVLGNPRWVCGLVGFMRPDIDTIRAAVLHVLRSEHMVRRLEELTRSSRQLEGIPQDRRVEYVISSLRIKIAAAEDEEFVANVYVFPPTDDLGRWREWAAEMRSCRFNIFLNGTGTARKIFWCAGCRGVDHEAGECPFPKMAGWKGPAAGERSHTRGLIGKTRRGGMSGGREDLYQGAEQNTVARMDASGLWTWRRQLG
ncbi:hypothetical protein C8T65DRAFT_699105 [Cerioporus squamosus]|nr:hypothetical protein C8T65DRAFT_699105 [Cerioporus squamosus]